MALSCVVSEIFNVEKYRYLEIPVKGQSRSLIVVPFDRLGMVSDQCSVGTLFLRDIEIFDFICRDLENRVSGPSRSLKMSPFDRTTSY